LVVDLTCHWNSGMFSARHFLGEQGLAGARFALDEQRALQGDGGIDRQSQVARGDVAIGTFEFHGCCLGLGSGGL
jgi:hypothetical protein